MLPPARFVSGLVSHDLRRGFIVANVGIAPLGVLSWLVVRARPSATGILWAWIAVETINGIGHPMWSCLRGGYTPGVATAPPLLTLALALAADARRGMVME